jgi:hypothetical protein
MGLVGVFSLGLVTVAMSLARFIVYSSTNYNLSDADGGMLLYTSINHMISLLTWCSCLVYR